MTIPSQDSASHDEAGKRVAWMSHHVSSTGFHVVANSLPRVTTCSAFPNRPTGMLDVAIIQSLVRKGVVDDRVAEYGHVVVVDECHHVSARSFEQGVRQAKARFVLGLSATVARKDGHHPIITMQWGRSDLQNFPSSVYWWSGLSLDDSPIVLKDLGAMELYALDLDLPR